MSVPLATLAALARRHVEAATGRAAENVAVALVVGLFALLAAGFLVGAATVALADAYGAVHACLVMAAVSLLLAGLVMLVARRARMKRAAEAARLRAESEATLRGLAASGALGLLGAGPRTRSVAPLIVAVGVGLLAGWRVRGRRD